LRLNSGLADKDGTDAARRRFAERFGILLTGSGSQPMSPSSSPSWPRARAGMRPGHMMMDGLSPACGDAAAQSMEAVFAFRWIDKVGRRSLALWATRAWQCSYSSLLQEWDS
jgi:hypothetical protein